MNDAWKSTGGLDASRIQAAIFDMDGVLVDSEPLHERAYRDIFAEMGCADTHGVDFVSYYGRSDWTLWTDFIERHRPAQPIEELLAWKQRHYLELLRREKPVIPDAIDLAQQLHARFPLALASGSLHPVIQEVFHLAPVLRSLFQAVVSVQDVPHGKPAPDVFLRAASLLGVPPAACCVIEDAPAGVEAARAAGMAVIAITNSLPPERLARATRVVSRYSEIADLLLGPGRGGDSRFRPPAELRGRG
ncbi:MAG TPA: HAD family phosphatase [Candidatus Paceibacterota bacterium]|nr:HAD family phosphatase [Verrucomicrobiota bacterium]HRZ46787.1 HAD family phosphatase [Candidatus Paceibacterota bacterium]HRZ91852.1 HAD family phosphatase [Candidatus Paceibacterota bacterium]